MRLGLLFFLLLTASAACDPTGPIPGGEIGGVVTVAPETWTTLRDTEVIQLETAGPYSVNLWVVVEGEYAYVASSRGVSRWSERIRRDPRVRVRFGASIYELLATEVQDSAERQRIAARYRHKYALDAAEDFPDAVLFRLTER